jgi:hypothetical protein
MAGRRGGHLSVVRHGVAKTLAVATVAFVGAGALVGGSAGAALIWVGVACAVADGLVVAWLAIRS